MSTVYAVVHTEIGKRAALKVVHHHVISASFTPARVLLEAQLVNRIAHGSIVDIFENGVLPDGRPYLIMERLEGWSLGQRQLASRITADEVIAILLQLCDVLTATHAAGIVHCDLKPENVFLVDGPAGPRSRVKVLDWGIAKVVTTRLSQRRPEDVIGTPRYAAPEQVCGREPTAASDMYSLGVMAYELFLEEQPFIADSTSEVLAMQLHDDPPPPEDAWPGIPSALTRLLLALLAKEPYARPTAGAVAGELLIIREQLRPREQRRGSEPSTLETPLEAEVRRAREGVAATGILIERHLELEPLEPDQPLAHAGGFVARALEPGASAAMNALAVGPSAAAVSASPRPVPAYRHKAPARNKLLVLGGAAVMMGLGALIATGPAGRGCTARTTQASERVDEDARPVASLPRRGPAAAPAPAIILPLSPACLRSAMTDPRLPPRPAACGFAASARALPAPPPGPPRPRSRRQRGAGAVQAPVSAQADQPAALEGRNPNPAVRRPRLPSPEVDGTIEPYR